MRIESLWQDARFSLRMLRKNPGFTAVAVLTLALGIGAGSAVFSVVNSLLLRPMPGKDNSQLLAVWAEYPEEEGANRVSYLDYQEFRAQSGAFDDMCAYLLGFAVVTTEGHSDRVIASYVTGNFFSSLGMTPEAGRLFHPSEGEAPGSAQALVLGYGYWQKRFHGNPSVVGRSMTVKGRPLKILGIAPRNLVGPFTPIETGVYLPLSMAALTADSPDFFTSRARRELYVLARPKSGVSRSQARASLEVIARGLAQEYPATNKGMKVNVVLERFARPSPTDTSGTFLVAGVFLAMVGLALLIACIDVTNLLLARASSRSQEMAVRASLGAGRLRLLQQMLTESLLLSLLGGAGGAVLGWWLARLIGSIRLPTGIPIRLDAAFDWRVFACIACVVILCAIVVGLAPAPRAFQVDLNATLREGGRAEVRPGSRGWGRDALVVAQVAGSLVVLVAAGLFLRSLIASEKTDLGFRPDGLLNVTIDANQPGYDQPRGSAFFRQVKERVSALPSVQAASYAFWTPMGAYKQADRVWKQGQAGAAGTLIVCNSVDEDYFRTLEMRLVQGRGFTAQDHEGTPRVAVINEAMARFLWPGENPLGRKFSLEKADAAPLEVVGVTRDARLESLFEHPQPCFFLPLAQAYSARRVLQVRTSLAPASLATVIEKEIHALDPNVPVFDVMPMQQSLGGPSGYFLLRIGAVFAGSLGGLCLALAVIGVYGVVSYVASQRTREVGIRVALGAQRGDVFRLMMGRGARLILAGLAIGLSVALVLARFMSGLLLGVGARDPLTLAMCVALLGFAAGLACWIPARRAMRVDPIVALRYE